MGQGIKEEREMFLMYASGQKVAPVNSMKTEADQKLNIYFHPLCMLHSLMSYYVFSDGVLGRVLDGMLRDTRFCPDSSMTSLMHALDA